MPVLKKFLRKTEEVTKELTGIINQISESFNHDSNSEKHSEYESMPKPVENYIGSTNTKPTYSRYGWNQLDFDGKIIYSAVLEAGLEFRPYVDVMVHKNDKALIEKVFVSIKLDNPKLFWVNLNHMSWTVISDRKLRIDLSYRYSESEAKKLNEEIDKKIESIACECGLTKGNDYERTVRFYEYITSHVVYNGDDHLSSHNIVGPILMGKAVCEGISDAINLILNRYGIACSTIIGSLLCKDTDPDIDSHAWNIVRLDNSYYHLDATQDLSDQTHSYLNVSDSEMERTHSFRRVVECNSMELNYDHMNGTLLPVEKADTYVIDCMRRKLPRFEVRLTEYADLEHFTELVKHCHRSMPAYRIFTNPGTYSFIFIRT